MNYQQFNDSSLNAFLSGKSPHSILLFNHFIHVFQKAGTVQIHPTKTMIGIGNGHKNIAWVTQFGKAFIHVVFPFKQAHPNNLCFVKIAQVIGTENQFNHHLRILFVDDVNDEVLNFMKMAYKGA